MKVHLLALVIVFFGLLQTKAQTAPKFVKYPVKEVNMNIYLPAPPGPYEVTYSEDKSKVIVIECLDSTSGAYYHFGAILVEFAEAIDDASEEDLLISYLDYLKETYKIKSSAGYGKGHTLSSHPSAKGILDYWTDADGDEWTIKAWIDNKNIAVMFVYGPKQYPNINITDIFFKGIRFPGDN